MQPEALDYGARVAAEPLKMTGDQGCPITPCGTHGRRSSFERRRALR